MDSGRAKSRGIGKDFRPVGVRHAVYTSSFPFGRKWKTGISRNQPPRIVASPLPLFPSQYIFIMPSLITRKRLKLLLLAATAIFQLSSSRVDRAPLPDTFFRDLKILSPIKNLKPRETAFITAVIRNNGIELGLFQRRNIPPSLFLPISSLRSFTD